jgi:hypothetical protein
MKQPMRTSFCWPLAITFSRRRSQLWASLHTHQFSSQPSRFALYLDLDSDSAPHPIRQLCNAESHDVVRWANRLPCRYQHMSKNVLLFRTASLGWCRKMH